MQITKDYLLEQIKHMEKQKQHAHEVAVASQAAIDVMNALVSRLDLPEGEMSITQEQDNAQS